MCNPKWYGVVVFLSSHKHKEFWLSVLEWQLKNRGLKRVYKHFTESNKELHIFCEKKLEIVKEEMRWLRKSGVNACIFMKEF